MIKNLKEIIDFLEKKLLVKYRFDKGAIKKKTNCSNCIYFKNNFCDYLKDEVSPKYTCNEFKKRD